MNEYIRYLSMSETRATELLETIEDMRIELRRAKNGDGWRLSGSLKHKKIIDSLVASFDDEG